MHTESVDDRFSYLFEPRQEKPRTSGITFVLGDGLAPGGPAALADLLEFSGAWIDWYKLVYSSIPFQPPPTLAKKLKLLADHDIQAFPGGNFLEVAVQRDVVEQFLEDINAVGCPRLEVSTTVIDMEPTEKAELIERSVEMGFDVHSEVGKKQSEGKEALAIEQVIDEVESDLDAGADKVIYESEAVETVLKSNRKQGSGDPLTGIQDIVNAVGLENLIFEVPLTTDYQVTKVTALLIGRFGPEVNLGNVVPNHVNLIEQQRRGVGPGTYGNGTE